MRKPGKRDVIDYSLFRRVKAKLISLEENFVILRKDLTIDSNVRRMAGALYI
jgi:hypothetical protein